MDYKLDITKFTWADAVGERFHIDEIAALGLATHRRLEESIVVETTFDVVPEPNNPNSSSGMALSVRKNGMVLGYLPEDTDDDVRDAFARIAASGMTATTTGTLWTLKARDGLKANIKVRLPRKFAAASLQGEGFVPVADVYDVPPAWGTDVKAPKVDPRTTPVYKGALWILKFVAKVFAVLIVAAVSQAVTGSPLVAGFVMLLGAAWIIFGGIVRRLLKKRGAQ